MPNLRLEQRLALTELRAAMTAATFLTRMPLPLIPQEEDVRRAGPYFPLVGALIGGLSSAVTKLSGPELGLTAQTLVTGALHLDALADVADAGGASTRKGALEIMRDPRIGAFGATALVLDLMLRRAALARCGSRQAIAAGALSRAVPVVLASRLPYARRDGAGSALARGGGQRANAAVATALAVDFIALGRHEGTRLAGVAAVIMVASGLFMRRCLGGATGDALGASTELTETILLYVCAR